LKYEVVEGGRIRESNREMDVAVTRNISRENRRTKGTEDDYRDYCSAARTTQEEIIACDEAIKLNRE